MQIKFSYQVIWHSSFPLRRETVAAGPSFLAAATTSGWPNNRIQNIHGSFSLPLDAALQGTTRYEPPPKETVGLVVEGLEILE